MTTQELTKILESMGISKEALLESLGGKAGTKAATKPRSAVKKATKAGTKGKRAEFIAGKVKPTSITYQVLRELEKHPCLSENVHYLKVHGAWVWLQFSELPSKDTRALLKKIGFFGAPGWKAEKYDGLLNMPLYRHNGGVKSSRGKGDPRARYTAVDPNEVTE